MYQYNKLIDLSIKLNKYEDLFIYIQNAKSRALSEKLKIENIVPNNVPLELYDDFVKFKHLKNEITASYLSRLNNELNFKRWSEYVSKYRSFLEELSKYDPEYVHLINKPRASPENLRDAFQKCPVDTLIIDMFLTESYLILLLISPSGMCKDTILTFPEIKISLLQDITKNIKKFFMSNIPLTEAHFLQLFDNAYQPILSLLSDTLIPKIHQIMESCNLSKIIFVPHREFHLVPFHLLMDNQYEVGYSPNYQKVSTSIISDGVFPPKRILIVRTPSNELKYAIREEEAIKTYFPESICLSGSDANRDNIRKLSKECDAVHFISHGNFADDDPANIYLLLSDGTLSFNDIVSRQRFESYSFSFLSACQTGGIKIDEGDEYISLNHAFMSVGVRSVISSLWPVEDLATMLFVKRWYYHYSIKGTSKIKALQNAQLWLRNSNWTDISNFLNDNESIANGIVKDKLNQRYLRKEIPFPIEGNLSQEKPFSHAFYWAPFCCAGSWS